MMEEPEGKLGIVRGKRSHKSAARSGCRNVAALVVAGEPSLA
jgi:hypothetical protein